MSAQTWGDLLKSQDDNETIEQAIARIVQEHDDDETAHLETGQSIEAHKASEIIDHLARSVYRDKLAFDRFQIDEHFTSIDSYNKSAGVTLTSISEVTLTTTNLSGNIRYICNLPGDSAQNAGSLYNNPSWSIRLKFAQITNQLSYFGSLEPDIPGGYGFKVVNGSLYAVYWDEDYVENTIVISDITLTDFNNYRCDVVAGEYIKFYVNDILKYTLTNFTYANISMFFFVNIKTNSNNYKTLYVQGYHYDEDYSA